MRTTLDIADDVLLAAKEIARRDQKPLGRVISELARRAFAESTTTPELLARYGIQPLPPRGGIVSNELIDRLRGGEGI